MVGDLPLVFLNKKLHIDIGEHGPHGKKIQGRDIPDIPDVYQGAALADKVEIAALVITVMNLQRRIVFTLKGTHTPAHLDDLTAQQIKLYKRYEEVAVGLLEHDIPDHIPELDFLIIIRGGGVASYGILQGIVGGKVKSHLRDFIQLIFQVGNRNSYGFPECFVQLDIIGILDRSKQGQGEEKNDADHDYKKLRDSGEKSSFL